MTQVHADGNGNKRVICTVLRRCADHLFRSKWFWLLALTAAWSAAGFSLLADDTQPPLHAGQSTANTPQRIVAMAPELTEILFALDLGDRLVGVTAFSDFPPEAKAIAVIGTFWLPDIEAVVAARPDMVIMETFDQQAHLAQRLRRLGYTTVSVNLWTVADLYEAIGTIGSATGRAAQADALLKRIQGNIAEVSARSQGPRPKVLYVIQDEPFRVAGRQTFINELIELAGGENAIGPTVQKYPPIGTEHVIASAPDVIIAPTMAGVRREALLSRFAKYERIPAVANGRICVIDDSTVRLGPRIDQAVHALAECIRGPGIMSADSGGMEHSPTSLPQRQHLLEPLTCTNP